VAGNGNNIFSGDGGPAVHAGLSLPEGVAFDAEGNLVIADGGNARVRVVAAKTGTFYGQAMTANDIYTVAGTGKLGSSGDGGPATQATMEGPEGLTVDSAGNLVLADTFNNKVRVVAEAAGTFYGVAMTPGNIYTVAGTGQFGFSGDGGPAVSAEMDDPDAIAVDAGNLLVVDGANNRIRQITG
jgi:sugar lactone lactonase YvrE